MKSEPEKKCTVLVPNKDDIFKLAELAKRAVNSLNQNNFAIQNKITAYCTLPLWAFFDDSNLTPETLILNKIISVQIETCKVINENFIFPVKTILSNTEEKTAEIYFGKIYTEKDTACEKKISGSFLPPETFPVNLKSFRIGTAFITDTEFNLYHDKWYKIKK